MCEKIVHQPNLELLEKILKPTGAVPSQNLFASHGDFITAFVVLPKFTAKSTIRTFMQLRWGTPQLFTARAESLLIKTPPSVWTEIVNQRCVIPVTAFRQNEQWFSNKDYETLFLAGLYGRAEHNDGTFTNFVTLLNRNSFKPVSRFYHRMPVLLPTNMIDSYCNPGVPIDVLFKRLDHNLVPVNIDPTKDYHA